MSSIKKINDKQTKIKLENGQRFKAKEVDHEGCHGCHFQRLAEECPTKHDSSGSFCSPVSRDDGRHIVWKQRKEKTQ